LTGTLADSYTPTGEGKFFFTVMAAFAELERDLIHQRTMAGLAAARAQGRVGGWPSVMDPDKLAAATARLSRGESATQIAEALGASRATLYRHTDSLPPAVTAAERPRHDRCALSWSDVARARVDQLCGVLLWLVARPVTVRA
jgi:DNA invertase Pin-like site-specific DNA recombinase